MGDIVTNHKNCIFRQLRICSNTIQFVIPTSINQIYYYLFFWIVLIFFSLHQCFNQFYHSIAEIVHLGKSWRLLIDFLLSFCIFFSTSSSCLISSLNRICQTALFMSAEMSSQGTSETILTDMALKRFLSCVSPQMNCLIYECRDEISSYWYK